MLTVVADPELAPAVVVSNVSPIDEVFAGQALWSIITLDQPIPF
jgi:hypothetical protein